MICSIQEQSFAAKLKYLNNPTNQTKPLYVHQFGLYLDSNHIVKCKGRINNSPLSINEKNSIFLPSKHPFIRLLVMSTHCQVMYGGTNVTLIAVYEKYWILKGRQVVKSIIRSWQEAGRSCLHCPAIIWPPRFPSLWWSSFCTYRNRFCWSTIHTNWKECSRYKQGICVSFYLCLYPCSSPWTDLHTDCGQFSVGFWTIWWQAGVRACTLISDNAKTFRSSCKEVQLICLSSEVQQYLTN